MSKFIAFKDSYSSAKELQIDLKRAGLESSNLIVGIDFTKSNEWTGEECRQGKNLHAPSVPGDENPYAVAISILGKTLAAFDDDNSIPAYGFGSFTTGDSAVFSLKPGNQPCRGFNEVLQCYQRAVETTILSGPTSFAPLIYQAINIVKQMGGRYHILVIIADGQVDTIEDAAPGQLTPQEKDTINAIIEASKYPLSIIMVGVGDGPWDMMKKFDDEIPTRSFDNFQFVCFNEKMREAVTRYRTDGEIESHFALQALMEVPPQYRKIKQLNLLGSSGCDCTTLVPVVVLDPSMSR